MKNNISIDELVRQGVAKGEEPQNLGAWANMERMLDGKNPYQKEEEDRKRRPWLILLLGFALCTTAVVGSYAYFFSGDSQNNLAATPGNATEFQAPSNQENLSLTNQESDSDEIVSFEESNNEYNNTASSNLESELYASNAPIQSSVAPNEFVKREAEQAQGSIEIEDSNSVQNSSFADETIEAKNDMAPNITEPTIAKPTINPTTNNVKKEVAKEKNKIANKTALENKNIEPTITEKYMDTMNVTEVTKTYKRDYEGKKKLVTDSIKYQIVEEKERVVVNPRYVELTKAQEEAAQRKTAIASNEPMVAPQSMKTMEAETVAKSKKPEVSLEANTQSSKKKRSFFSLFKSAAQKVNQKGINMAHTPIPIYTGMFVGLNAALINTPHNFGGFQAGLTAMTPLSRLLTLRTEARFIHKNNSGYTVTDNRHDIISTTVDATSIFKTDIYKYQIDSVSRGYNLKNFYSLQMPILLSANIKKFNAYAGLNVNYGFRMNVNSTQRSNPITYSDTVENGVAYTPRVSSTMKFTSDDFGSRLGLGYTVGGAYNFNPNLYVDLRMSSPFWDNTKGAAKQEISDVFFKIPSFQLSIGYRFRKYKPE